MGFFSRYFSFRSAMYENSDILLSSQEASALRWAVMVWCSWEAVEAVLSFWKRRTAVTNNAA